PTDRAIVASCGKQPMSAIHTAFISDVGSMRAYIFARFSTTIVLAPCPASAVAMIAAGQLIQPSGSPEPDPENQATSSKNDTAVGNRALKNPPNADASAISSFGTSA